MVYGLYVPSPAIGFLATVTCGPYRRLDTSTEVSGPHDFAVRKLSTPVSRAAASTASPPAFVTFAKRPSGWDGMRGI